MVGILRMLLFCDCGGGGGRKDGAAFFVLTLSFETFMCGQEDPLLSFHLLNILFSMLFPPVGFKGNLSSLQALGKHVYFPRGLKQTEVSVGRDGPVLNPPAGVRCTRCSDSGQAARLVTRQASPEPGQEAQAASFGEA